MFHVQKISSFDAPELRPYATMRRSLEHEEEGIFVAEGVKVVRRLLESDFTVVSVVLPAQALDGFKVQLEARPERIAVYVAEKKWLETLTGFSMFQGVLAVGKIPARVSLESILQNSPSPRLLAAVDGLTNAENLGALVRNCAAFGVQALLVGETSSSPFLRRAVRNSMGAIFELPILEIGRQKPPVAAGVPPGGSVTATDDRHRPPVAAVHDRRSSVTASVDGPGASRLAQVLLTLRGRGVRCIAAHPRAEKYLSDADFSKDCCIVFGSEGSGLSKAVLESCDEAVSIPVTAKVDSLNVGAAAAVFLYEAARGRSAH